MAHAQRPLPMCAYNAASLCPQNATRSAPSRGPCDGLHHLLGDARVSQGTTSGGSATTQHLLCTGCLTRMPLYPSAKPPTPYAPYALGKASVRAARELTRCYLAKALSPGTSLKHKVVQGKRKILTFERYFQHF